MLTQDELREKRYAKSQKRKQKRAGLFMKHIYSLSRLKNRMAAWNASKDLRYWKKHFHFHSWSRMGIKDGKGGYETVGYICNKCGIEKKSWKYEIKKLFNRIFGNNIVANTARG